MRFDLQVVASWIEPGSKVLDLGCGAGDLLQTLQEEKGVAGSGIELEGDRVAQSIAKGLSVVHGDINEEIRDYPDAVFDYVILSQTLMQVVDPVLLIQEMLRVGKKGIVSFPNFAHLRHRLHLFLTGGAPVSKELPYQWYDTPNIRVIAIRDFRRFCKSFKFSILRETAIRTYYHDDDGKVVTFLPNLRAAYGIYMLERQGNGRP